MRRTFYLLYGAISYALFLGLFAYMALFLADVFVLKTVDTLLPGQTPVDPMVALLVDLGLILLFGLQHSIMARPAFKIWWTRLVPPAIERTTYVMVSNIVMAVVLLCWQPIEGMVWQVENETARTVLWGLFALSWLSVPVYTLMINHFDLFGLQQVWVHFRGTEPPKPDFRTPWIYRFIRHPIYLGWTMSFWVTPTMSVSHLVWAGAMTFYMLMAIPLEERDLVAELGSDYELYRKRVPGLVPVPGKGVRDVEDVRRELA